MKTKVFKIKETCVFCTINFFMTKYSVMTKCLVTYLKQANETNNFETTYNNQTAQN